VGVPGNFLNRLYYADRENIVHFDRYVLAKNIEFLVKMHALGVKKRLSVNVSGLFFVEGISSPVECIFEQLQNLGAPGLMRYLDLEVVEWMEFKITEQVIDTFVALPFSCLKIDRVFIQKMAVEEKAFYITKGFTETAKSLNICVIAEGVETREQVEILQELGVEYAQGYFFSPPVPESEFLSICQRKT
jgi:EAL domain-containing protein (putative c-di-GMP-specific phosphodiesterase class I)